jgi:hypothetical protein
VSYGGLMFQVLAPVFIGKRCARPT